MGKDNGRRKDGGDGETGGRTDDQADRRPGGQTTRRTDDQADRRPGGQTTRRTGGQAGRRAGRQAGRPTGGQTDRALYFKLCNVCVFVAMCPPL